jgi:hypothetical protein
MACQKSTKKPPPNIDRVLDPPIHPNPIVNHPIISVATAEQCPSVPPRPSPFRSIELIIWEQLEQESISHPNTKCLYPIILRVYNITSARRTSQFSNDTPTVAIAGYLLLTKWASKLLELTFRHQCSRRITTTNSKYRRTLPMSRHQNKSFLFEDRPNSTRFSDPLLIQNQTWTKAPSPNQKPKKRMVNLMKPGWYEDEPRHKRYKRDQDDPDDGAGSSGVSPYFCGIHSLIHYYNTQYNNATG